MTRLEKAVAALEHYADETFYFPRSIVLECQKKGIRLAPCYSDFGAVAKDALAVLGACKPQDDAYGIALRLLAINPSKTTIGELADIIQQYAETYASERCAECRGIVK